MFIADNSENPCVSYLTFELAAEVVPNLRNLPMLSGFLHTVYTVRYRTL